jgi:ankyrin repeat protein
VRILGVPHIDVNCKDDLGWTSLHHAAHTGNSNIVEVLLKDHRILPRLRNNEGKKPENLAKSKTMSKMIKVCQTL